MEEETSNPNIQWDKNKKGFASSEKITRKTNIKKALEFEAKEKKALNLTSSPKPSDLPKGLKKIRKKIKEVYDDDEDEEYYDALPVDINSSLLNALHEEEKKQLQQKNVIHNQKMQQSAGKMEAIMVADQMVKSVGMRGVDKKLINKTTQDATLLHNPLERVLSEDVTKRVKSGNKLLSEKETVTVLRGIERIKNIAQAANESQTKALEKLKLDEVINAGSKNTNDHQVAEMILKKSGRKEKKDVNKVVEKSKQLAKKKKLNTNPKPKTQNNSSKETQSRQLKDSSR